MSRNVETVFVKIKTSITPMGWTITKKYTHFGSIIYFNPRKLAHPTTAMSFYSPNPNNNNNNDNKNETIPTSNRRLYNPYQDLKIQNKTLYNLPTSPEFLFSEEALAQRRSWGENLTYYTGIAYLSGSIAGASKGFFDSVKEIEKGDSFKLRVNRVLNGSGHTGMRFGNRVGVIGLMYAGLESGLVAARGTDDILNSVAAGLGTGALFRAAKGVRSAAVAGAIGGVAVGTAVMAKQMLKRYVPI